MDKTRMGKRVASLLLSLVMMLSLLPTAAYAAMADGVETQGASVSENGTGVSDDSNSSGGTGDLQVEDSEGNGDTGAQQVGDSSGSGTADDTTGAEGGADPTDSVNGTATYVAYIGETGYETLDAAITAAGDSDTVEVTEGRYTLNGSLTYTGKAITVKAANGANVIFDMSSAVTLSGAKITFENVTFDYTNADYTGLQHTDTVVYNNCTINGKICLYANSETFNGCYFKQTSEDYNVWTYGAKKVAFNDCTFKCNGKAVNVYIEKSNASDDAKTIAVNNCTVNSDKANKAFLNIKNSTQAYDVTLSGTNTVNGLTADGTTGSALYQVETTKVTETTGNPVTVKQQNTAGEFETVYEVKETVAETTMDLDAFIKAVEASGYNYDGNGVTVKWSPVTGCYDTREGHDCTAGNVKATGNTPKRVSADYAQYQLFSGLTQNVTIKNVKFVYEPAAFTICANSGWAGSGTVTNLAELQFENKGDVKLLDCSFDGVAVAVFNDIETASTAVHGCSFTNMTKAGGGYAIHYLKGGKIDVSENTFENVYRGMLVQSTVNKGTNIVNNNFSGIDATNSSCYMVKLLNVKDTDIVISGNTTAANAPVNVNVAYHGTDGAAIAVGDRISTIHTAETDGNSVKISTGGDQMTGYTAPSAAVEDASGITVDADGNVTVTLPAKTTYVAEVKGVKYKSLQAAIDKAGRNATVRLLADTRENVTISTNYLTLDLNGHTLNGGTVKGKPALTVTARVTVKDSSAAKTGTIMREDTAENSGVSSHYVIDIQDGWLFFESGSVTNNSGVVGVKGASLVRVGDDSVAKYPGLTISGGTFTQDNFIVIKVDRGTFYLKEGGTLNSKNSYAVENWKFAEIKGGTVNGTVAAWTYSGGHNSDLTISGGTVNGNVLSVNYGSAEGKLAKVSITGGTVNGALDTRSYDPSTNELTSIDDATKATIAVTGGTFSSDPTKYVVEDSAITPNADGTFGVAKAYLAKVGGTSYYTMDEAFKAQTASGEAIVLLRDYTTGSTFNSGSIDRTVDLNGHTWTCTGTDANSAAFEINYSDATLTVKNGKVFSSQLVGLIPSAMGGTIKYDNSSLVFENIEMTTTAHSGIETNGNNTNDTVKLVNSELNVPNGFGIYFPSSGTLTIDNSKINAKTMGVQVCAGSLNISGAGTAITVSGDGIDKTINDGAIEDGAAISIVNRIGYKGLAEIKVEGGKFTAKSGNAAVKAYDWANQTEGDFTQSDKVFISGGTFSSEVDKSLCADGFIPTKNADGTYGVKEGADGYVEDENGNVTISTAEGLFYFAKKANAGNNFAGKTVKLANDIDLNNEKWTPIGIYDKANTLFKGTFDGQNHAVTGLKVEESRKNGVGFFGKVYTGTIKNLTVEGSVSASNCNYVGGIVGHGYATITNCTFKGTVGNNNSMQVGGIAGSGGFTVTNCSVYADVTAECWAGGIVGNCQDGGAYTNCYVDGVISAERTYWGGGAAGITPVPLYPSQVISGCYSNTVVKVAGEEVNCPIIAAYNNPLDYNGYSGGLKIYDNSWNKQKNSNDSYPIYAEKDKVGGVLMEGMTAARDNSLIMLEDDLNYVTGDLSKVRIMAGSSVTQAQIDALAVASVGDSKYQSLAEAIDAAQDGQTVTLLADAAEDVVISKSITLDLGGKTLTNTNASKATISVKSGTVTVKNGNVVGGTGYYNIEAKKDANLTLTDVTATAGNTGSSMIDNWGTLTITSGTYTGGLDTVKNEPSAKVNITGGTFTLTKGNSDGYTGVVFNYGELTISGGEFVQSDKNAPYGQAQVIHTDKDKNGSAAPSTVITGGTFKNLCTKTTAWTVREANAAAGATKVSGGAFNKSVKDYYCAEGFIPTSTKDADGNYGVKVGKYVAEVGSKKYETLADAIRLTAKGKTITLLCDVEQNTQLTINKSITLDLNGKTIKNTADIWGDNANAILSITKGAKVTITGNGTIDAKENDCYTINVVKGDLTIENGTFYGNVSVVQVEEGTLSVKGGTFDLHQKWEGSSKYLINCIDDAYVGGSANVAISGGTFVGFDPNVSPEQKVDGKTSSFAAPGTGITKNADGTFTAAAGMTAQILDKDGNSVKAYRTLAEAVAAAQDGQTVRLLADVTLDAQIATGKAITIDGQSKYTIKAVKKLVSADNKAGMFYRTQSAKGTLTFLNVTLDGGGFSKIFLNEGGAGETVFDGVTSTNGGGIAYGSGIHISGGGSHATIRNSTLTGSTGTMELNDANYYAANDLWVGGNVYVTVENSVIGTVFVNSAPSATATNGVVHGQLTITGESTKITYLSGEEEAADKLDKFGNNGSLVKIDSGYVEKVFDKGSYAISGGTFKTEVKKEWCAAGYVPADNGNGTYGVAVGKFTVMVTSRTTGSDSPVANVAGGGSDITYAQGTKVTASAISGYTFVGWFVNEYTGTPYSTALTCEVKPTDDCTMIAVYEPISGGVFALEVSASKFTVNGGATQRSYLLEKMPIGTQVTVVFKGSENFMYWVNESGKVVSTSKTYTFSMGSATTLKAVYAEKEEHQAMVVFISHTQQVISSKGYTDTQEIQFPEPPIKMGATFVRWSMTEAEIRAAMATTATGIIVVEPVYEFNAGSYTVTVNYPNDETATYTATVGKITTVTAKSIDGKVFKCWKNGDTVLGYTETLRIAPRGDLTLTAEYVDAGTTVDRLPVIALTEISASQQGAKYAVSFTATRSVPNGYTVTEQGVLVSTDSRYGEAGALDAMKLDADGVKPDNTKILKATNTDATGVTVLNGIVSAADRTVYGRAYMILRDSSGTMVYVYSDTILSGSYNSLNK